MTIRIWMDGWLSSIVGHRSSKSTLGANIRTHLVDALPELLEWKGVTDDVLHGKLTSGDHGDCLDMDSGHVHWTRSWTMS